MGLPTRIPLQSDDQWAKRIIRQTPQDWTGDAAKEKGGKLYSMAVAAGEQLNFLNGGLIYAWKATRIATAEGEALDLVSSDYLGDTLPRIPGESDDSFRARIQQYLLLPKVTRAAIIEWLSLLTGKPARLIEPWNLFDTAIWDRRSFWDVDTPTSPFRFADPGLRCQLAAILNLPAPTIQGNNPVRGWDAGFYWDTFTATWWNSQAAWFLTASDIDARIKDIRAAGIKFWRHFQSNTSAPKTQGTVSVPAGRSNISVGMRPYQLPIGLILQPSWNTACGFIGSQAGFFRATFNTPAPPGAYLQWHVDSSQSGTSGTEFMPLGNSSITIPIPAGLAGSTLIVQPSWCAPCFITNVTGSDVTVDFGVPAPPGATLNYQFAPLPGSGVTSVDVDLSEFSFTAASATAFNVFMRASWDTDLAVTKVGANIVARSNVPAPSGGKIYWATFPSVALTYNAPPAPPAGLIPPPKRLEFTSYDGSDTSTQVVALTNDSQHLFVASYGATPASFDHLSVLKVNVSSGVIEASRDYVAGSSPGWLFLSPDNSKLFNVWFDASFNPQIDILNPSDLSVVSSTAGPIATLIDAVMAADGSALAFFASGTHKVYVFDTTALTFVNFNTAVTGFGTMAFKLGDPTHLYVAGTSGNTIYEYDTSGTLINTFTTGLSLPKINIIRVHPSSGQIFGNGQNNSGSNNFFVYDPIAPALISEFVSGSYWGREVIFDPTNTTAPYVGYSPMMAGWPWVTKFDTTGAGTTVQFDNTVDVGFNGLALDVTNSALYCSGQDSSSTDGSAFTLQSIAKP